jgi:hypothetical protein
MAGTLDSVTRAWSVKRSVFMVAVAAAVSAVVAFPGPASAADGVASATDGSAYADVSSVSCPSAGTCAAVGFMQPPGTNEVFTVNQTQGTWQQIRKVSLTSLTKHGVVTGALDSVSCSSPGNCAAGGDFLDGRGLWHAFVVTQAGGRWGKAQDVLGINSLKLLGESITSSNVEFVSCPSAGNCSAVGSYSSIPQQLVFVVTETKGVWSKAEELPGIASALKLGTGADFTSLSCASAGNCAAGGIYSPRNNTAQAFVASEKNGVWGSWQEVPGSGPANKGDRAFVNSVSCPAAGDCVAVGYTEDSNLNAHPFISQQKNGVWGRIKTALGVAALPTGGATSSSLDWVMCASAGSCTGVGDYTDQAFNERNFVLTETHGIWTKAKEISLGSLENASITAVSCATTGNCSAGGYFSTGTSSRQLFVVNQTHWRWGKPEEIPGSAALNSAGYATFDSVSCGAPGNCSAGGSYSSTLPDEEPFLVSEANGTWGNAEEVPGLP